MMTTAEKIAVMQAHVDGKPIQCTKRGESDWWQPVRPIWNFADFDYRVKPDTVATTASTAGTFNVTYQPRTIVSPATVRVRNVDRDMANDLQMLVDYILQSIGTIMRLNVRTNDNGLKTITWEA